MWKNNKKTMILTSIVTLLPVLPGILLWNRLPEMMATHFGLDNEANGFSSRPFAVFGLPLFLLAVQWVAALAISYDPRKQNISPKLQTLCLWIVPLVSLFCGAAIYPYNLGMKMNVSLFGGITVGVMFIILGNYLPKMRQNYTMGIKIPWTLANEENWNRTHRFAGYIWVAGGILMLLLTFTGVGGMWAVFALLMVVTVIPCVYSFWLHAAKGL